MERGNKKKKKKRKGSEQSNNRSHSLYFAPRLMHTGRLGGQCIRTDLQCSSLNFSNFEATVFHKLIHTNQYSDLK